MAAISGIQPCPNPVGRRCSRPLSPPMHISLNQTLTFRRLYRYPQFSSPAAFSNHFKQHRSIDSRKFVRSENRLLQRLVGRQFPEANSHGKVRVIGGGGDTSEDRKTGSCEDCKDCDESGEDCSDKSNGDAGVDELLELSSLLSPLQHQHRASSNPGY